MIIIIILVTISKQIRRKIEAIITFYITHYALSICIAHEPVAKLVVTTNFLA